MFKTKKQKKNIRFELVPMIDVMMILVLFLAVMAFLPQLKGALHTNLPSSGTEETVSMDDLVLSINSSGTMQVGEESVTRNSLIPEIKKQLKSEQRIVIAADKTLPYEQVVDVLSALQAESIQNVALATDTHSGTE